MDCPKKLVELLLTYEKGNMKIHTVKCSVGRCI